MHSSKPLYFFRRLFGDGKEEKEEKEEKELTTKGKEIFRRFHIRRERLNILDITILQMPRVFRVGQGCLRSNRRLFGDGKEEKDLTAKGKEIFRGFHFRRERLKILDITISQMPRVFRVSQRCLRSNRRLSTSNALLNATLVGSVG